MKASGSSAAWRRSWAASLLAVGLAALILIAFAVPVFAGIIAASSCKALLDFAARLAPAWPFGLWPLAASYPGWAAPAAFSCLGVVLLAASACAYLYGETKRSSRKRSANIFGPGASRTNAKGSARVYSDPELISEIDWTCNEEEKPPYGGLVIGCLYGDEPGKERLVLAPKEGHGFIVGMSGSGKTQFINYPTIWAMANSVEPCSAVILDSKGDLYGTSAAYARSLGIKTYVIDFGNTDRSCCINLLEPIVAAYSEMKRSHDAHMESAFAIARENGIAEGRECDEGAWKDAEGGAYQKFKAHIKRAEADKRHGWAKAEELTRDIALGIIRDAEDEGASAGAQHWLDVGRSVLEAIMLLTATYTADDYVGKGMPYPEPYPEQRTLPSVLSILRRYAGDESDAKRDVKKLVRLFDGIDPAHPACKAFSPVRSSTGLEIATAISETLKFVTKLVSGEMESMLNRSDIDFAALGRERTFLYLVVPSDRPAAGRMFVLLFQQIHQKLVAEAKRCGGRLAVHVNFLLEEFASVSQGNKVKNIDNLLTESRSYNISLFITSQNLANLEDIYGECMVRNVLDNCGTKVLVKTSDVKGTAEYFSSAVGTYTFTSDAEARSRSALALVDRARTLSEREEQRRYFTEDELARWPASLGVLVLQALPGKNPDASRRARRLGWNGIMYAMVVQARKAAEIGFIAEAFGLGDDEELSRRMVAANAESALSGRTPLVAWNPDGRSIEEREATMRHLYAGGISLETRREMQRTRRKRLTRKAAREMLASSLDAGQLHAGPRAYTEALIEELYAGYIERFAGDSALEGSPMSPTVRKRYAEAVMQEAWEMRAVWYADLSSIAEGGDAPAWLLEKVRLTDEEKAELEAFRRALASPSDTAGEGGAFANASERVLQGPAEDVSAGRRAGPSRQGAPDAVSDTAAKRRRSLKGEWLEKMRADIKAARSQAKSMDEFVHILEERYAITMEVRESGIPMFRRAGEVYGLDAAKAGKGFLAEELRKRFEKKAASKGGEPPSPPAADEKRDKEI